MKLLAKTWVSNFGRGPSFERLIQSVQRVSIGSVEKFLYLIVRVRLTFLIGMGNS